VVQESEAKSNEHVQIGATVGTADLMDVKAASHHSLSDWLHDSAGLGWCHRMLEWMSKGGFDPYGWRDGMLCCMMYI